jgi:hypothetical protein
MSQPTLRTAEYDEDRRWDLARAVKTARLEAFRNRSEFLRAHPDVKPTSLYLIEHARPLVGEVALKAVGEALGEHFRGWSKATPEKILRGEPAPALEPKVVADVPSTAASPPPPAVRPEVGSDEWLVYLFEKLYPDEPTFIEIRDLMTRNLELEAANARLRSQVHDLRRQVTERPIRQGQP